MKQKKLLIWGILNLVLPLPVMGVSVLLDWILLFGIFGVIYKDNLPDWATTVSTFPTYAAWIGLVASMVLAIIKSAKLKENSFAIACIVMSSIAILLYASGWMLVLYIGSHF